MLSALLTGVRTASTGAVTWGGTDLATAARFSVWPDRLVTQDYTRWPMDLRAIIRLGRPCTEEDALLLDAARAAMGVLIFSAALILVFNII
ncbi:hypothetical protein AB0G85_38575, partial [Streptomyces sioyaensis]